MGVFSNAYYESTAEAYSELEKAKRVEDLSFFEVYLTSVISTFSWKNIPNKNAPISLMENMLQYAGRAAVFVDDDGDIKIYSAFPAGALREDGQFTKYQIISLDGKVRLRDFDDIVLIYNNCTNSPYLPLIYNFAKKSSYALRSVDSALQKAQKPAIIKVNNEQQVNLVNELCDGDQLLKPYIALNSQKFDNGNLERVPVFDNRDSDVLSLWDCYVRYRNLFYTTFGINNVEIQKRERLTMAEGAGNDEIVRYSLLNDMYMNRIDGCARANAKFGLNLDVEINRDISTVFSLVTTQEEKINAELMQMQRGINPAQTNEEEEKGDENDNEQNSD